MVEGAPAPAPKVKSPPRTGIERLEGRIAPAAITFPATGGGAVTISISKGTKLDLMGVLGSPTYTGTELIIPSIALTGHSVFAGADISITTLGDVTVGVGNLDATGLTLGTVNIHGDLGRIEAGSSGKVTGVQSLAVDSLGLETGTQTGTVSYTSTIIGKLGSFHAGTVEGAFLNVVNGSGVNVPAVGNIGSVVIDHLLTARDPVASASQDGLIQAAGNIGSLKIGVKNAVTDIAMQGGAGNDSATVLAGGTLGPVTVTGKMVGGDGIDSAAISSAGNMSTVVVHGSLLGGDGATSATIRSGGKMGAVTIGTGTGAAILGGTGDGSGLISSKGNMGAVRLLGDLQGTISHSGGIVADGTLASIKVTGSVLGGSTVGDADTNPFVNGYIEANAIGAVVITGNVEGGSLAYSGVILSEAGIGSISIGGHLKGGNVDINGGDATDAYQSGSIMSSVGGTGKLGAVTIAGGIIGGTGDQSGTVLASTSIGSVHVSAPAGSAMASVLGGGGSYSGAIFSAGAIGTVRTGDIEGGAGAHSGSIEAHGTLTSATVGDIIGGSADHSGSLSVDDLVTDTATTAGRLVKLVAGTIQGGSVAGSGAVFSDGSIGSLTAGALLAGLDSMSGQPIAGSGEVVTGLGSFGAGDVGALNIANLGEAAAGTAAAAISGTVTVGGTIAHLTSTQLYHATVSAGGAIGAFTAKTVTASNIYALGDLADTSKTDVALGRVTVTGNVQDSRFLAGFDAQGSALNGEAQIGAVSVSGNWTASDLIAGVSAGTGGKFGTADDAPASSGGALLSKIASVVIKGTISDGGEGPSFGFEAEQIGSFHYSGHSLTAAQIQNFTLAPNVIVQEIAIPS
jgi:hypothetical protein